MKGIYESLRQKELELQQALDDAAEANERELRRVQKSLQDALGVVNQLLDAGGTTAEARMVRPPIEPKSAERADPIPMPDPKKVMRSSQSVIATSIGSSPITDASQREFP